MKLDTEFVLATFKILVSLKKRWEIRKSVCKNKWFCDA